MYERWMLKLKLGTVRKCDAAVTMGQVLVAA